MRKILSQEAFKEKINTVVCGDSLTVLKTLPDEVVDMSITSPPYWALRDYGIKPTIWDGDEKCKHKWDNKKRTLQHKAGETNPGKESWFKDKGASEDSGNQFCSKCSAWKGTLGLEPTFDLFIKHLCDIYDEVKRVLKKDGTCWVNLGDTYSATRWTNTGGDLFKDREASNVVIKKNTPFPDKCLCQIPQRFSIEMCNRGWILRNVIIWKKPNCMPSSVKDRFTVDFEYLFFFVKSKKYYFEQQLEPLAEITLKDKRLNKGRIEYNGIRKDQNSKIQNIMCNANSEGRNKRCVWSICPQPYPEAHFAVYPPELLYIPIKAGCPKEVCKKCGKGREAIFNKELIVTRKTNDKGKVKDVLNSGDKRNVLPRARTGVEGYNEFTLKGYTDCGCKAGWSRGLILDPFMGSGTTAEVARKLGRNYIGIELSEEYIKLCEKRLKQQLLF